MSVKWSKPVTMTGAIILRKNQEQEASGMSASHYLMTGGVLFAGEAKTSQSSCCAGEDLLLHTGDSYVIKGGIEGTFSNEDMNGESTGCGHSKRHCSRSSKGCKVPWVDSKYRHDELIKEMTDGIISASRPSTHVDYNNCLDMVMGMKELSAVEKIHSAEYLKDEKDALMFLKFDKVC